MFGAVRPPAISIVVSVTDGNTRKIEKNAGLATIDKMVL
jgi:hypothetical protein